MVSTDRSVLKEERDLITQAVHNFHSATGVPVALGAQMVGAEEMRIIVGEGLRTDALRNLRIDSGAGVGGRVLASRRVMGVTDYLRSQSITHELDAYISEEGIRSLAAVPVIVNRKVRAVLYAGVHAAVRLSERVLDDLTQEARCLEQALAVMDASVERPEIPQLAAPSVNSLSNGAEWEQIRHAHSRLRLVASRIEDGDVRRDVETICEMMITTPRVVMDRAHLSTRELDVLSCVAMGRTNGETADEMGIKPETVKSYLRSCMRKLGAHNRYEAVSLARQLGVLP